MKTIKFLIIFVLIFISQTYSAYAAVGRQEAKVVEVVSGDTVRLEGGKMLRYAGIKAPPLQHIIPLVREYGENSLNYNKSLVEGKKIFVEWGPRLRDDRGNLLGYVFLENDDFVNLNILKNGQGKVFIKAPNLKYAEEFRQTEWDARREKKGLWVKEPDNPFKTAGYVGEKNTKIYYLPNSPELERIPQAQLVKFAARVDAKAAGYKACATCSEDEEPEFS